MLSFIFPKNFSKSPPFQETFLIQRDSLFVKDGTNKLKRRINPNSKRNYKFPVFVYLFNEIFIIHNRYFYRCHDFLSCFLKWIEICCEDPKLNGYPLPSVDILPIYKRFFPENEKRIEELETIQNKEKVRIEDELGLPEEYEELEKANLENLDDDLF